MTMAGAPSSGTVAMNFGAVSEAGGSLSRYSRAIGEVLESLDKALNPVRETWYNSGSQSGADAQAAEHNLRGSLNAMVQIIHNLGGLLNQSAVDAAALDGALGGKFQQGGRTMMA